jgi:methionine sulfoxide reductase heme-binding subunit
MLTYNRKRLVPAFVLYVVAYLPAAVIAATYLRFTTGGIKQNEFIEQTLHAGEYPGAGLLAAVLWCTPLTQLTGRSFASHRRHFGIGFAIAALSNQTTFLIAHPVRQNFRSLPFTGTIAVLLSIPLALTSWPAARRSLGYARWKSLHRITYLIAGAVMVHVWIVGQHDDHLATGTVLTILVCCAALVLRIPPVSQQIQNRVKRRNAYG